MGAAKSDFYRERAAESAQLAQDSTLENVRERNLRAEAAWHSMAEAASASEAERERTAAEKAERDEA